MCGWQPDNFLLRNQPKNPKKNPSFSDNEKQTNRSSKKFDPEKKQYDYFIILFKKKNLI